MVAPLLLWTASGFAIGAIGGPVAALWWAAIALVSLWWPKAIVARLLSRASVTAGLGAAGALLPTTLGVIGGGAAAVWLIAARPRGAGRIAVAVAVTCAIVLIAMSGGRGSAPEGPVLARTLASLLLASVALSWPHALTAPRSGPVVAALMVVVGIGLRGALHSHASGSPPVVASSRTSSLRAARLGARVHAGRVSRDQVCWLLAEGQRKAAVRELSWGGLVAPRLLGGAEGALWRASIVGDQDPRQAQAIARRVFRRYPVSEVIPAVGPRDREFVLRLAAWASPESSASLVDSLMHEAVSGATSLGFTSCPAVPLPGGSPPPRPPWPPR